MEHKKQSKQQHSEIWREGEGGNIRTFLAECFFICWNGVFWNSVFGDKTYEGWERIKELVGIKLDDVYVMHLWELRGEIVSVYVFILNMCVWENMNL